MTKFAGMLAALLLMLPAAGLAQEYYTLPEIREQAAQGWHETYTDKYGREITVDLDVQVFGEEIAPVIEIASPNYLPIREVVEEGEKAYPDRFLIEKNNPYLSVCNVRAKGGSRTYLYSTEGEAVDYDRPYGEGYGSDLTVGEAYDFMFALLERHGLDLADDFFFDRPRLFQLLCNVSQKTGEAITPAFYLIRLWAKFYDMPVFTHAMWSFHQGGWPQFCPELQLMVMNEDSYSLHVNTMTEVQKLAEDIPLCSLDTVKESIAKEIEAGWIPKVFGLKFGYSLYNEPGYPAYRKGLSIDTEAHYYAVPSWLIECVYMPSTKMDYEQEVEAFLKDNPELGEENYYYSATITINAQTGEMLNPLDTSKSGTGDADYKGFISWEDVR